jgi:hypothetical protein
VVKPVKQLLRPERLRQVPEQFSWIDQALVQRHLIDHCEARAAALYLFLVTVADAHGLSYYGGATLTQRLHLSGEQLGAARAQLIDLDLIAYRAPLYQVLAISGTTLAPRTPQTTPLPASPASKAPGAPVSLAQLLRQLEHRRGRL